MSGIPVEINTEITEKLMAEVDASGVPSPEARATKVLNILREHNITTWDALCFAALYLRLTAMDQSILMTAAAVANRFVYLCHYVNRGFKDETSLKPVLKDKK